ncbi:hypothetical protein KFK09_014912 [Dendrobium nobile]|uniref:Uncharacterized protein n=1 Tax=Dendrobium nobile TaxID=94219 RepID=A0A8T3B4N4_DENNO|nr:hypothetical protein KFK09_014912 [Dendrobium nobile]
MRPSTSTHARSVPSRSALPLRRLPFSDRSEVTTLGSEATTGVALCEDNFLPSPAPPADLLTRRNPAIELPSPPPLPSQARSPSSPLPVPISGSEVGRNVQPNHHEDKLEHVLGVLHVVVVELEWLRGHLLLLLHQRWVLLALIPDGKEY